MSVSPLVAVLLVITALSVGFTGGRWTGHQAGYRLGYRLGYREGYPDGYGENWRAEVRTAQAHQRATNAGPIAPLVRQGTARGRYAVVVGVGGSGERGRIRA